MQQCNWVLSAYVTTVFAVDNVLHPVDTSLNDAVDSVPWTQQFPHSVRHFLSHLVPIPNNNVTTRLDLLNCAACM